MASGDSGHRGPRHLFEAPEKWLAGVDPEAASRLIGAAADVALVIDDQGLIQDLAFGSDELSRELDGFQAWRGQPWTVAVTVESRPKIEALLREATTREIPRWRHVNHPSPRGADVPVMYSAVRIGDAGRVVVLGRDLRAIATLQQRLVDAQQSMERDYWRMRQVETRYRLLFQTATEAVLILDATTQKVLEANPAAGQLLGENARKLVGRAFPDGFDAEGTQAIQALLAAVRTSGRAEDVRARLADGKREFVVSASLFRQENATYFLVRLSSREDASAPVLPKLKSKLLKVAENVPDGLVVTGPDGRILTANRAFLDLTQLATEEQARGESLDRWLGRPGVDLNVLIANLRQHGSVRLFATTLRGEYGTTAEVEISAVALVNGEQPCLGFTIRNVGRRLTADLRSGRELPRSVEQLTELVGRVSLKDLVREATDVIERLCIEAALELTRDNRASAAEMLGLSRQSLYVKLRRYGLGDLGPESNGGDN
ncbi:MAG: transcriptional regulator PpsR [Pseudomonadota bacterium]